MRSRRRLIKAEPSKLSVFLLSCGIAAPLLYVATDILLAMRWEGYSYRDQTISELNAIGSPTRTLSIVLGIVGYAFVTAFGVGVGDRRLPIEGCAWLPVGWSPSAFSDRSECRSFRCTSARLKKR